MTIFKACGVVCEQSVGFCSCCILYGLLYGSFQNIWLLLSGGTSVCAWSWFCVLFGGTGLNSLWILNPLTPCLTKVISLWEKIMMIIFIFIFYIQSSAVITRSNLLWYCHWHCNDWGRTEIKLQTHNRHPIPHPHGRAMGCLLWGFERKLTAL